MDSGLVKSGDQKRQFFNLEELISQALNCLAPKAEKKGIELIYYIEKALSRNFMGDRQALEKILSTLLENAVGGTDEGQVVVLAREDTVIGDDLWIHFSVNDTGSGLSADQLLTVFESSSKVSGLEEASNLAQAMDGHMWVESPNHTMQISEERPGSCFHFIVKLSLNTDPLSHLDSDALRDLNVLVIGESAIGRQLLEKTLVEWQMQPLIVETGREAIEKLESAQSNNNPFKVVILDAQIYESSDLDFAEKIKSTLGATDTKLIMLSSCDQNIERLKRSGNLKFSYLRKPVSQTALLTSIQNASSKN
jgi:two-component system, sensor histidine kinase and response regulator